MFCVNASRALKLVEQSDTQCCGEKCSMQRLLVKALLIQVL
jgi:hypothetical protein